MSIELMRVFEAIFLLMIAGGLTLQLVLLAKMVAQLQRTLAEVAAITASLGAITADVVRVRRIMISEPDPPAFVCPRCGKASWNPNDAANGYCGACHDITGGERRERPH